jgi:hypothetical protein
MNMAAILTVTKSDGSLWYHERGHLFPTENTPFWRRYATKFKTVEHAARLARKKYRLSCSGEYTGWTATTIDDNYVLKGE